MAQRAAERVRLGRSEVEVTRLGLGTAPLGGLFRSVADAEAQAVLGRAFEAGLRYVDTAPYYGHGTSERRVGEALRGLAGELPRSAYTLSTKVGRLIVPDPDGDTGIYMDAPPSNAVFDFSRDGVRRSLEESLERLGLERVDVVYIHDPDDHEERALAEAGPAVRELREEGLVGAVGVGMNQSRIPTRFVREVGVDAVLLAGRYTLLDQSGADDLLPACLEHGTSVVIGGVYNSGLLADPRPGATFDYEAAPDELVTRAQRLAETCARHGVPLKAAAIQYPLAHPAVATVLSGARSVAELDENIAMLEYDVPDALWDELAASGAARFDRSAA